MKNYELFYIVGDKRLEAMLICSLARKIDWCEEGLKIVSWRYAKVSSGKAESLNEIFKKHSQLQIDKRRTKPLRTINIGDTIIFDGVAWIISSFGFIQIPEILFKKISFEEKIT